MTVSVVTRTAKGSALTYAEMDANFMALGNALNVTVVTRTAKGSALTYAEMDANFTNLAAAVNALTGGGLPTPSPITLNTFRMGYNVRAASYFTPTSLLADYGKYCTISQYGLYIPFAGINGVATYRTDTGVALTSAHSTITVLSSDPVTGTHRIQVTADATDTVQRYLNYSVRPTFVQVTRDGVTGRVSPEFVAGMTGKLFFRNLDMVGQNNLPLTGKGPRNTPDTPSYDVNRGYYPYQDMVDGVAAIMAADPTFLGLWYVLDNDMDDADVTALATYMRDKAPTRTTFVLEQGNEQPWNTAFPGAVRAMIEGARAGFYGAGTAANPQPALTIAVPANTGGVAGNTDSPAVAAGGLIFYNLSGQGQTVWRAKAAVPAGSEIGFTLFTALLNFNDLTDAAKRWRSWRHDRSIEIFRAVFGDARFSAQIVPVVMAQAHSSRITDQLAIERTWLPGYWAKVKGAGFEWYHGHLANAFDYTQATSSVLETAFRSNMPAIRASLTQMVADCAAMGVAPMLYEGLTHPDFNAYQSIPAYRSAWDSLFSSVAGQTLIADIVGWMRLNVPGLCMVYDLIAGKPWSIENTWVDTGNARVLGTAQGLTSSYIPTTPTTTNTLGASTLTGNQVDGFAAPATALDAKLTAKGF